MLSPTRELALQIAGQVRGQAPPLALCSQAHSAPQFEALGAAISIRTSTLVGGVDIMAQAISLGRRPHVLVGTPGRVSDHLVNTKGFSLRTLQHLVLDEADRILSLDFEEDIDKILKARPAHFWAALPLTPGRRPSPPSAARSCTAPR